jgi:hypothetical protein
MKTLTVFFLLSIGAWGQLAPTLYYGIYNEHTPVEKLEAGYFISRELLDDMFFQYPMTVKYFSPAKKTSPYQLTEALITSFGPIIATLEGFIVDQKKGIMSQCADSADKCLTTFQSVNGMNEKQLATEIVKASYCFGTDPFVVTSKIRQESRFDMTSISNTGAIGLTQLTTPGLEEILDQLGHRGAKYAYLDNVEFLSSAVACYSRKSLEETLVDFPEIKTVNGKSGSIHYTSETIKALKAWILPNKKQLATSKKLVYIQRQVFLGQILLKIYLAYSKKVKTNQPGIKHYESALRMFNGDDIRVKYAKEVIKYSKQANTL